MKIAIIPARGGSQRIPGKNKRLFHGKPIIEYSIDAAEQADFDVIIVSSDDPDILEIAHRRGARFHIRPAATAADDVGTQEVARSVLAEKPFADVVLKTAYENNGDPMNFVVAVIYATAPLIDADELKVVLNGYADTGIGAKAGRPYTYSIGPDYFGQGWMDAGQFYVGRVRSFMERVPLEDNSVLWPISAARCCDINTEADWRRAEVMYTELQDGPPPYVEQEGGYR